MLPDEEGHRARSRSLSTEVSVFLELTQDVSSNCKPIAEGFYRGSVTQAGMTTLMARSPAPGPF